MAIKKFNAVAGLSVGTDASIHVVDENGNVNTQFLNVSLEANIESIITQSINAVSYLGDGGNLANITAANITGSVPEAVYAITAGSTENA